MNPIKKLFAKPESASLKQYFAQLRDQVPPCARDGRAAQQTLTVLSSLDDTAPDAATMAMARGYRRPLLAVMPTVLQAERFERAQSNIATARAEAEGACEHTAKSHRLAAAAAEAARTKAAGVAARLADLQRERALTASTATNELDESARRLQQAVEAGDVAAEEAAAREHAEAEERQRATRTPLHALDVRIAALAEHAAQLQAAANGAEATEDEALRQVMQARVRLASVAVDERNLDQLGALVALFAATREARDQGVPAGVLPNTAAIANITMWVGDTARGMIGDEHGPVRSGVFAIDQLLRALTPSAEDLQKLRELDGATLDALKSAAASVAA